MRRITLILASLAYLNLNAQNQKVDSLALLLDSVAGKERIDPLISISNATFFSDTKFSRKHAREAEQLLYIFQDDEKLAKVYNLIGITFDIEGEVDSSKYYFTRYYEQSLSIGNLKTAGNALNNLGMSSWNSGKFDTALDYFYQSLKIADSLSDHSSVAKAYNNIALINQELNNYRKALEFNFKALDIRKQERTKDIADSYNNIGICYKNLGLLDSAIHAYQLGYSYLADNDAKRKSDNLHNTGNVFLEKGALDQARNYYLKALKYKDNKLGNLFIYNSLAEVYYLENNAKKSVEASEKALAISKEINNFGHLEDIYFNLTRAYAMTGNIDSFEAYFSLWDTLKDSIFSVESSKTYSDLEVAYETDKKEQQILLQKAKLEEQKAMLARDRIALVAALVVISLLVSISILWKNRIKKKQQIFLQKERLKAKELEINTTITSQERERSRYARDLHDGFGQMISILNMNLGSLKSDDKPDQRLKVFEESEKIIDQMYGELKNICFDLMPQTLIDKGLKNGLEELAARINKTGKVFLETNIFGLAERLADIQEIALYRISQEWTNNILKYSDADKITIQITRDAEEITLLIEDNGMGFDKSLLQNSSGNGWKNLNTRSNLINGKLEFETSVGRRGNTLIVNAPIMLRETQSPKKNTVPMV